MTPNFKSTGTLDTSVERGWRCALRKRGSQGGFEQVVMPVFSSPNPMQGLTTDIYSADALELVRDHLFRIIGQQGGRCDTYKRL